MILPDIAIICIHHNPSTPCVGQDLDEDQLGSFTARRPPCEAQVHLGVWTM